MVWMSSFIAFLGSIYGWTDINDGAHRRHFTALYFFLLMGVQGAYLTSDLLNMYVFFEILLCSSFVLLIINLEKAQLKGSLKYVILNLFSSTLFLIGAGLLYGKLGSLNLADMAMKLQVSDDSALILSSGILLLMAFGLKAGIFPLFFWLPVSYHNPPVTVSVIFSGLLTKVGIYAMLRLSTLIFESHYEDFKTIMLILAMATMVVGVMGAASQLTMRKILSFHIISQVGYIIAGFALMTMSGLAAAVYYIVHDIAAKANLFFISGMIHKRQGTDTLSKNGNLLALSPALSILFFVSAFSLAGLPPLSGFWAKLGILQASVMDGQVALSVSVVTVGLFTLYSMTKIWISVFWEKEKIEGVNTEGQVTDMNKIPWTMWTCASLLATFTLHISFFGNHIYEYAHLCAEQLLQPMTYIQSILGSVE